MQRLRFLLPLFTLIFGVIAASPLHAQRRMENLGRGVVAVRASATDVLVSWRLLGFDPGDIGFNVYRAAGGAAAGKLNAEPLVAGTNFTDTTADLTQANTYFVRPVLAGTELTASSPFTLPAGAAVEPIVRLPLRAGGPIKFVWVGDLDGDGEYDYVIDRQTAPQKIEAYRRNGEFLWEVDMGPNSLNQNNIEGGSSTVDVGHNDGVTVYDFDSDGRAEVAVRIANGVRFGDGATFTNANDNLQFIAILDGMTGALRATAPIPTDYLADGPLYARFGVGYLNGTTPSLVAYMKNRIGSGDFNLMICAWNFNGATVSQQWKWLRGNQDCPDGHNTRIIDLDGDGRDEVVEIGFALNGDGTLRYTLGTAGVVHGDRFHIAKIDPDRPGLQGYGVQQNNPSGLLEYYYDAATGALIWQHFGGVSDVGRGMVGDVDPAFRGMEVWSFSGLFNGPTNQLTEPDTTLRPWPQHGLWWDGDITMELLNSGKFEKWNPANPTRTNSAPRLLSISQFGAIGSGVNPLFNGDILGDWREEVVYTNAAYDQLVIFSTNLPSPHRLYTLAHNPAYRNSLTLKGYMQSHHVDYFLGEGMAPPPPPNIVPVLPSASAVPVIASFSADSGAAANDRITNDTTPTLSGTALPGATVVLSRVGLGDDGSVTANGSGAWTFSYPAPLADGKYYILARVNNGQDNVSFPFLVEIDTVAPEAPAIQAVAAEGSGGYIVHGTGGAGLTVAVTIDGVGPAGSAVVQSNGIWSLPYAGAPLSPAAYTFRAVALDVAGNASPAALRAVDLSSPRPTIAALSADTGSSSTDGVTSDPTLSFSGTAAPSSGVTLFRLGSGVVGTTTANPDGTWTFDYSGTPLDAGVYSFSAYSEGGAGSPAFAVTVDLTAPGASSIARFSPGDASTNVTQVTFRAVFAEPVTGVDAGDFSALFGGGAGGVITAVTPVNATTYDVVLGSFSGEGTVRLDLNAAGTGITDLAGNELAIGFTNGQTYTRVLTGNGVWTRLTGGGLWSQNASWLNNIVADGAGNTADFSTLDLTADQVVQLDAPRTLTNLVFGDTAPASAASWVVQGDDDDSNVLTLASGASVPTLTVQPLGTAATATLAVPLVGSTGFTKAGAGTLVLDAVSTLTGGIGINAGTVRLGSRALFTPSSINIANAGAVFLVAGGSVDVNGGTTLNNGSNLVIDSGSASFAAINGGNTSGNAIRINGGSVTADSISFQRSTAASLDYNTGLIVKGGTTTVGPITLGTANSNALASVEGGSLTATGPITLGNQSSGGRGGHLRVTGGTFVSTDGAETGGIIVTRRNGNASSLNFLGGTSTVERITLGFDAAVTSGSAALNIAGGTVYLGAGGIQTRAGGTFVANLSFASGALGAKAAWSTALNATLPAGGNLIFHAADAAGAPFDITLSGVLSGAGGFRKTGDGMLTLAGENTFTGSIELAAGTLNVTGSLAAGGTLAVSGGRLTGGAGVGKVVVLNAGGTLAPGSSTFAVSAPGVTWNEGGALAVTLGADGASGRLAIMGALTRGAAGARVVQLTPGAGFTSGSTYTLATFASTDFTAGDFVATGLPPGTVAVFNVTASTLEVTVVATPVITSAPSAAGKVDEAFTYAILASNQPASFGATGLPAPLALNPTTGVISGVPAVAGTFPITLTASNVAGTATAALQLVIAKQTATITLTPLRQAYDGTARPVIATTTPAGLDVTVTYDGEATAPKLPGNYAVSATVDDPDYVGSASGTLVISITALVRQGPTVNGEIDGSMQVLLPQNVTLNSGALIAGDLLVPGNPTVRLNGSPAYGSTLDEDGTSTPANHVITLNSGSVLRHVVRRVDALSMPSVSIPPAPTGTRAVTLNQPAQSPGSFATLRDLTLNHSGLTIALPAGNYGNFVANNGASFVLGVAGASEPAVYQLTSLTLNGASRLQVVGPVILTLGQGMSTNGLLGSASRPDWLTLQFSSGGLALNSGAALHGTLVAPAGTVTINANATVRGTVTADRLTVNTRGVLEEVQPQ